MTPTDTPEPTSYDPTFLHARREALYILAAWGACLAWTVGYCALTGYDAPAGPLHLIVGMPSWVFWGVLVPWIAATVFSVWFSLSLIADDDLD